MTDTLEDIEDQINRTDDEIEDWVEHWGEELGDMSRELLGIPDPEELSDSLDAQTEAARKSAEEARKARLSAQAAREANELRSRTQESAAARRRRRLRAGNSLFSGASGGFNVGGKLGDNDSKVGRT